MSVVCTRHNAIQGQNLLLSVQYYGEDGEPEDADVGYTPSIEIFNSSGIKVLGPTTDGVERISEGLYHYTFPLAEDADIGLWTDRWTTMVDETELVDEFKFLVKTGEGTTGTVKIGDDVNFDFTDEEINGINILLKILKMRLRSNGRKPARDQYGAFTYDTDGNLITEECNVFSDEVLVGMLMSSLSEFNMIPFFTTYTFADRIIYTTFATAIIEGAVIFALASQALVEKGREFTISDGGISYQPAALSDLLTNQFGTWLTSHRERLKFIKNSIRPGPAGFGTYSSLSSGAPAFSRLRHQRARRIV
jgi:hypothetical protein